jgi:hypothetical protein
MIDPYLINLTQEHDDEYLQKQFALYSLSIQMMTHNTYGSHVSNLQPKIGHEEIFKIRMNTLHLDISYYNNNKNNPNILFCTNKMNNKTFCSLDINIQTSLPQDSSLFSLRMQHNKQT